MAQFGSDDLPCRVMDPQHKIEHWTQFDSGGLFPAMEVPDLLVSDLRDLFRHHR